MPVAVPSVLESNHSPRENAKLSEHLAGWRLVSMSAFVLCTALMFQATAEQAVVFEDPILEEHIRDEIGKPEGTILDTDLAELRTLHLRGKGISDLSGLEYAVNLYYLWATSNSISDLSPLAGLTSLTRLALSDNQIVDIGPLEGLTAVYQLLLSGNSITNIEALAPLTRLTSLTLYRNQITNIGPLSGATELGSLDLGSNAIYDLGPLAGLTGLVTLKLDGNAIDNVEALADLAAAKLITLDHNGVTGITPLRGLAALETLTLLDNPLGDDALCTDIPALQSRGVGVRFEGFCGGPEGQFLDFCQYWPMALGNRWEFTDGGSQEITDAFSVNGFEVWERTDLGPGESGEAGQVGYYVYVGGTLYRVSSREVLNSLPEIGEGFHPLHPEIVEMGAALPYLEYTFGLEYSIRPIRGALSSILEGSDLTLEDFPMGEHADVLGFWWTSTDPYSLTESGFVPPFYGRGIGPMSWRLASATINGVCVPAAGEGEGEGGGEGEPLSYDIREYWPPEPGTVWSWSPLWVYDAGLGYSFCQPVNVPGFEVWKVWQGDVTVGGLTPSTTYFVYLDNFLYSVAERTDLANLPDLPAENYFVRPLFPTDLTPGRTVYWPDGASSIDIVAGPLSHFLPIPAPHEDYGSITLGDFETGDVADCIALYSRDNPEYPFVIFGRGLGPLVFNYFDPTITRIYEADPENCDALNADPGALTLAAGVASGEPGSTVTVPVSLLGNSTKPTHIEFDLYYPASDLEIVEILPGAAVEEAGKTLESEVAEAGSVHIVIHENATSFPLWLGDGPLVEVTFAISAGGQLGDVLPIEGANASAADNFAGAAIAVDFRDGAVVVGGDHGTQDHAVWYVDQASASGIENGLSWDMAFTTVQAAIDAASLDLEAHPDLLSAEVWVAEGIYAENRTSLFVPGNFDTFYEEQALAYVPYDSGSVQMRDNVQLYGGFAGTETERSQRDFTQHTTTIDGGTARDGLPALHVVVAADNSTLDGFTITGGRNEQGNGGGLISSYVSPTIQNCLFIDNTAESGGAIYAVGATLTITHCRFVGNTASYWYRGYGGAIYRVGVGNDAEPFLIADCVFEENGANTAGGALYASYSGTTNVVDCVFRNNWARTDGGGAMVAVGTVASCLFEGNSAEGSGGGLLTYRENLQVINSIFDRNEALETGGGMFNSAASPRIVNCTFTRNVAGENGGALSNADHSYRDDSSLPVVVNCVVWDNAPNAIVSSGNSSADVTYSIVEGGYPGGGNLDSDPLFADLDAGDLRLQLASPAIDAGTTEGAPTSDILGVARPQWANVDMGAYEFVFTSPINVTGVTPGSGPMAGGNSAVVSGYFDTGETALPPEEVFTVTFDNDIAEVFDVTMNTGNLLAALHVIVPPEDFTETLSVTVRVAETADAAVYSELANAYVYLVTEGEGEGEGEGQGEGEGEGEGEGAPEPQSYTLSVSVEPDGSGRVLAQPSDGPFGEGTVVTLTAEPEEGWRFDHWTGHVGGPGNPATVTIGGDLSVTAYFVLAGAEGEGEGSAEGNGEGTGSTTGCAAAVHEPPHPHHLPGDLLLLALLGAGLVVAGRRRRERRE